MTNSEVQEWRAAFSVNFDGEIGIAFNALARTILAGLEGRCPAIAHYQSEQRIFTAFLLEAATHDEARKPYAEKLRAYFAANK